MKMFSCPKCGLKITNIQKKCPKCHTKIDDITGDERHQTEKVQTETKDTKSGKQKTGHPKFEVAVETKTSEKTTDTDESKMIKEDMIAAVVEAEALAVIEAKKAATKEESVCETCMAPVVIGQNFCQLCGASIFDTLEPVTSIISKSDEDADKWIAAFGYIVFFIPILFGFHGKSKFVNYHAKQSTILFIASTVLFIVLVVFRNVIDGLFTASSMQNFNEIFTTVDISWRHGTGILFRYYLIGMIYALHLMPFAFMISGLIYSIQGKKKPLPLMGRFLKKEK